MSVNVKKILQDFMVNRCYREYSRELGKQQDVYDAFLRKQEESLRKEMEAREAGLTARVMTKESFVALLGKPFSVEEDVIIVTGARGVLHPLAEQVICRYFAQHPGCMLAYADEDVCLGEDEGVLERFKKQGVPCSQRCFPNLKPVASPETFLSYQYFGNIWAVHASVVDKVEALAVEDVDIVLYDFLFKVWEMAGTEGVGNIPEILYHRFVALQKEPDTQREYSREEMESYLRKQDELWGYEDKFFPIKQAHLERLGVTADFVEEKGYGYPLYQTTEPKKISILIPSKDNPGVLETCVASIRKKSTYPSLEIIVIDNGSSEENKAQVEELSATYQFEYLYEPMEFNYSVMNNLAASKATGELLLLLNDDMEVVTPDWLERMAGQAMQEGVGAVGAKLLYPGTTLIQHVGVTNAVDGPVHKLLKKDDGASYNRGRNKLVYNVLGVTGACLMVKKEYFERLGGLHEQLRVAYNDVDLCFALYEMGLRNVIRNDVVLYHHESLSRGSDAMSPEKLERLKVERALLYRRHPGLYATDPYEGANNSGGAEFGLAQGSEEIAGKWNKWQKAVTDYTQYPSGVLVGLDYCEKHEFIRIEDEETYVIQGFALLPEADNCRYCFDLVLTGEKHSFVAPIEKRFRPNMAEGVPNASNVELTGFVFYIEQGELPADTYKVGIFAKDRCSRQRLFQETGQVLCIEEEE